MKKSTKNELHTKTAKELTKELSEKKDALSKLKIDKEMGKLKNTSHLRSAKQEIAVISTLINEKLIAEKLISQEPDRSDKTTEAKEEVKADKKKTASVKTSAVSKVKAEKAVAKGGKK